MHTVVYGFVDASGQGFGSSLTSPTGVAYTIGVWGRDDESQSSNYRELHNLVSTLERLVKEGNMQDSEIFMFTDNSTAEAAYYKGNTPSRRLFHLVLCLRQLEMAQGLLLQVIHAAGTRMIAQGTDGLSRGDMCEGVMMGQSMLAYIPLHLNALERQPAILIWVRDWVGQPSLTPLTPEEWYDKGHGHQGGRYTSRGLWLLTETHQEWLLWTPPPAAAGAALEELLISRHKRTHINHIVVIPRLYTATWRKKLFKVSDLVFEVPGRRTFWPAHEHKPLIIGLTLHFSSSPLGNSDSLNQFWTWQGNCKVCGRMKKGLKGLFCANFCAFRGGWRPCDGVWCGGCYTKHAKDRFYQYVPHDESGFEWR